MTPGAPVAQRYAEWGARVLREGAPADVRDSVEQRVLDVLGLQLGALPLETSAAAIRFARAQGGSAQASATGVEERLPATQAAFVNGVLAHSLDYDDTHLPSILHPSASVVPAALAAAELVEAPGDRVLDAIAVGLEVVVRLGMAGYDVESNNSVYFEHGQHATSICGAIGSAVAVALILGLDVDQTRDAIGIAASMASGVIEGNRTGGSVKRIHCGWAAHAAVSAAELARAGITGPPTAIEGRFGLLQAFLHGKADTAALTADLGEQWSVPGIFFKPYPANHFTHTAVDAAARLRARGIAPQDVVRATLGVSSPTVRTIGEPIESKRRPETGYQAQFSGPYAVALGFFGGSGLGASLADYTDDLAQDPERREFMERVEVVGDAQCDEIYPYQFPAVLRVELRDGRIEEECVLVNRGGSGNPLSTDELRTKFRENASRALPAAEIAVLEVEVGGLRSGGGVGQLGRILARARA